MSAGETLVSSNSAADFASTYLHCSHRRPPVLGSHVLSPHSREEDAQHAFACYEITNLSCNTYEACLIHFGMPACAATSLLVYNPEYSTEC